MPTKERLAAQAAKRAAAQGNPEALAAVNQEIEAEGQGDQGDDAPETPPEATAPLNKAEPADLPPAPAGAAYVAHPEGIGCSFQGIEIVADENGHCLVPVHAVEPLEAHGFKRVR